MKEIAFEKALRESKAYKLLLGDIRSGLGHAYAVVSSDDEIVAQFFSLLAATLYCDEKTACLECGGCRRALDGNNPDVYEILPDNGALRVAQVKAMTAQAYVNSVGERKVFFVHRADLMTAEAQNKLLKTLEEPPENVTFFLGTANEYRLLDTVRSRCRAVYMDVFDRRTVYESLLSVGVSDEAASAAAAYSEGQLGRAKEFADSPKLAATYAEALDLLVGMKRSPDVLRCSATPSLKSNPKEFLPMLATVVRDVIAVKSGQAPPLSPQTAPKTQAVAADFSLRALALTEQLIGKSLEELFFRVDAQSVTDNLLFSILEVKHKCR